jgi:hypothetical protein
MPRKIYDAAEVDRQIFLQSLQLDRIYDLPAGYTVARQSDFESSTIWRVVIVVAVVVIAGTLFSPASHAAMTATHQLVA